MLTVAEPHRPAADSCLRVALSLPPLQAKEPAKPQAFWFFIIIIIIIFTSQTFSQAWLSGATTDTSKRPPRSATRGG